MKCQAAVLRGAGKDWEIQEITLDPPREGEVLVKIAVAGICHTDDHFATGDSVPSPEMAELLRASGIPVSEFFPLIGGHEGAGVVAEVGPGVRSVQPGDGTVRRHLDDEDLTALAQLGTFADYIITAEQALIKLADETPFHAAALVSCGVTTGWGSATAAAGTEPGDTVVVIGTGRGRHEFVAGRESGWCEVHCRR
jgi:Zn-dependent alcohol dehydrogenase